MYPMTYGRTQLMARERNGSDLGSYGLFTETRDVRTAASLMVNKAEAGVALAAYNFSGEGRGEMMPTSGNLTDAHLRAGYWLAVASRLSSGSGAVKLAELARDYYRKGYWASWNPATDLVATAMYNVPAQVQALYKAAGKSIQRHGSTKSQPVAAILGAQSERRMIETKRQSEWEKSPGGTVIDPVVMTAVDVAALTYDPWSTLKELPWWGWMFVGLLGLAVASPWLVPALMGARAHKKRRK